MAASSWALTHISRLLPLDEDSLKQIIEYTSSLPKEAAAEHLKNLLGDSAQALEFIASFNSRRENPKETIVSGSVPEPAPRQRKKKPPLHKLPPPRRPEDYGNTDGAYHKKDQDDEYMPAASRSRKEPSLSTALSLSSKPEAVQLPVAADALSIMPKLPPSAAGALISDLPNVHTRTASPKAGKARVAISGGTAMHGASATLRDLDSAIRALEFQTNPSLADSAASDATRACDCQATQHALLAAAPNCLNCGKIICAKEGIGPCTFCHQPLLSSSDIQAMVTALREERGHERMQANNAGQRRPDVAKAARPFHTSNPADAAPVDATLAQATAHRDRLLGFQAQNARRTHVIDEAADFETPVAGQNMWSSPVARAAQLKRQQQVLREQQWSARPEWEQRRVVVSVDLVGGKVVRHMAPVERPPADDLDNAAMLETDAAQEPDAGQPTGANGAGGTFSKNPLIGALIRPVWKPPKGKDRQAELSEEQEKKIQQNTWRRVQDDASDNEAWILNGGIYGGRDLEGHTEEPAYA